jgi:NAD(P)H-nitrite reductase
MAGFVIVGNGVTGIRAAEVLRRRVDDADITILAEEPYPFYRRPQLADFATGVVGEARLWAKKPAFYEENRLNVRLGSRAVALDPDAHAVTLADGAPLTYDKLLVASGRRVGVGALKGSDLAGVNHFKTLDEARAIRDLEGAGKTGVVYGDGLVALELVRALTTAGFTTTYLVPEERLWPEVLDEEAAAIIAGRVKAAGAEVVTGAKVEAVEDRQGRAAGLVLAGGKTYSADIVGVCAGYRPAVEFLPDGGRGFKVDAGFATPWEDVYAAGDVTVDPARSYFNWLRSWRHGAEAGVVLAGGEADLPAEVNLLNMAALGLSLVAMGRTVVPYRSTDREMVGDYPVGEFYKKLVFDTNDVLVGGLLVGSVAEAGALEEALRARTKKADMDPALLHQMFDVTYRTGFQGVQCPVCRHEIQLSPGAAAGDLVTCPVCGTDLVLAQGEVGLVARGAR